MSFKSSLNALFKLSGKMAMPSISNTITYEPRETPYTFTAPDDGYLCAQALATAAENEIVLENANVRSAHMSYNGWGGRCFVPVHKGDQVKATYTGFDIQTATLYFTKLVGGGFLRFINGLLNPCKEVQYA